ncbi:right-handed parallel beta-helix repeat-containing protein [Flavobacterium sp. P4023]|uniref:Right-handed parallel beta-helix repeat-containing protein n=1 Tax=Flavobacterium flabelliforme TaxID=2816119 RepID=A0ABS5CSB9_9FLAO|nr:right-handed parallel beta-helix repeat-containing protein [Flavobacterium flabelliforme]MBP4141515.1 right-handed parallel beta-helix repeat-containing protein [Flavobacterium flabelliforme]
MKTTFIFKIVLSFFLISQLVGAQNNSYSVPNKVVVKNYYKGYKDVPFPKNAYKLERILPKNPNRTATIDYTDILQKAINKYKIIIMPNFPILINAKGLVIPSNSRIFFNKNSAIFYKGPAKGRLSDIVKIYNVSNVKIYNAKITGSKKEIVPQTGEWSAGICILNSSNIEINNFKINSTWGDGVFIGSENGSVSSDIIIKNGFIDNARRDGISITSANNLLVDSVFIANTSGTLPMTGIQIEPSLNSETLNNITLSNIYTFNNPGGLGINLNTFSSKNNPKKNVRVNVINYTDEGSNYSFGTSINDDTSLQNPTGTITITNAIWKNPKSGFYYKNSSKYDVKVILDNVKKYKNNKLID